MQKSMLQSEHGFAYFMAVLWLVVGCFLAATFTCLAGAGLYALGYVRGQIDAEGGAAWTCANS